MITNNCKFTAKVHEEPRAFLEALMTNCHQTDSKAMFQHVMKDERSSGGGVVAEWDYMATATKSCALFLHLQVKRDHGDENTIRVTSVEEEGKTDE